MANGLFAGGDGTEQNPYLIEDAFDLDAVRNDLTAHYKLISNIDLDIAPFNEGEGWICIGGNFTGVFDGSRHIIKNMYIRRNESGLFSNNRGVIKNLIMTNVDIFSNNSGVIAAYSSGGTIESCQVVGGSLVSGQGAGGIVCSGISGNIINCCLSLEILKGVSNVGGIFGVFTGGKIENCYVNSSIEGSGECIGGLVGRSYNNAINVRNCYFTGSISGSGLVGPMFGSTWEDRTSVKDSFWYINTTIDFDIVHGTELTTQQMKMAQTFIDAGWDKEVLEDGTPVWQLKDGKYPKLWFEVEPPRFLLQDGQNLKAITSDGLTTIKTGVPTEQDFVDHGFEDINDLVGSGDFTLPMRSNGTLGEGFLYSRKLSEFDDIDSMSIEVK